MSLIKKPSQLTSSATIKVLIYGQPGLGKTTIGLSAPKPVLIDFDGGARRVNGAHQVDTLQVENWQQVIDLLASNELAPYSTIVVDTVGKMLDFMSDYLMKREPKYQQRDGSLSLKGFGARKVAFIDFIKKISIMGKHLVFVAHEREDKDGDKRFIRPEIGGSSLGDLIKELDLVGYMRANGYSREICWSGTDAFYGKNACNLPPVMKVPAIIDEKGQITGDNNFLTGVFDSYNNYLNSQSNLRAKYDILMERANAAIAKLDGADATNALWESFQKVQPIWDSKIAMKSALDAKASELGLTFNPMENKYGAA